jgi:hypothetical protein
MFLNYVNIWGKILIIPVLFFLLFLIYHSAESNKSIKSFSAEVGSDSADRTQHSYPEIRPIRYRINVIDTVYTLKNTIIEVSLKEQIVYIRHRDGKTDSLPCSTGTPYLEKGQDTKSGIFIVRTKLPELISRQFDDTKCLNWVGFSYGIGFHSLESKKYYWSLGKRPSSHGCVRLTQDGSKELYNCVELGTPVIVHKNKIARTIAFLPEGYEVDTNFTRKEVNNILKQKLKNLYTGRFYDESPPKILVNEKYVGHDGFDVGEMEKVPEKQMIMIKLYQINPLKVLSDRTFIFQDNSRLIDLFAKDTAKITKE